MSTLSNDGQEKPVIASAPGPAATEDVPIQTENIQPDPVSPPQPPPPAKTFFGLAQDSRRQRPVFNDDYVERFPEDPYGEEIAPNARIWRVYVEEAAAFDENMIGQSRDGLDVMLVFAGLFSAVVTSFLVQVSQNLQADFSEMSALLLHDLLLVQLSMADGAKVNITTPSVNPAQTFDPDAIDVWINGLWVVSLTASLVVALAAVLVKQWLHRYMTFPSGAPGLRSHVRQFRFMGLEKWRVRIIIGMLPIVMHISLMLFFAGLALFYVPLRASLAWTVGTITVLVCLLYLISNTIPIIFPQCPYQTPLTDFIHHIFQVVPFGIQSLRYHCFVAYRGVREQAPPQHVFRDSRVFPSNSKSLTQLEFDAVGAAHANLSVDALNWLYHMSSNSNVHTLVLQGISGLPAESRSYATTKWRAATDMQTQRRQLVREALRSPDFPVEPWVLERLCRSYLCLPEVIEDVSLGDILSGKDDRNWPPRFIAAIRLVDELVFMEYETFFIRYTEVSMHPLIWEDLVLSMLEDLQLMGKEVSFVKVLLLVIVPTSGPEPKTSLMTGSQVVWTHLQSRFWDKVVKLHFLEPYYSVPGADSISSYHRTLIAAGKLAISHVRQYRHDLTLAQPQHLRLLARVVERITAFGPNKDRWTGDTDFLISVLVEFREISFSSIESSSPLSLCLNRIRSFYRQSCHTPEWHFPALDCFLQSWAGLYNCVQYDSDFSRVRPSDLKMPIDVMGHALYRGREEAYRIFTSRGWMEIIFTEWAICGHKFPQPHILECYITGLHTLTSTSDRRKFCEFIHQPQQLMLVFMLLVAEASHHYPIEDLVTSLSKICPTHATSWSHCSAALTAILAWAQTPNPAISLFPWPCSLQSLEKTEAFRKYPLVDWIARRFAARNMEVALKIVLKALHEVLDNAENVDGVLMPDRQKPDEGYPPPTLSTRSSI